MLAMLVPNGISRVACARRLAERQTVARARAVEPREAFPLETLRHLERRATAPGDRDETDGRFGGHLREYSRSHYDRRTQKEEIS